MCARSPACLALPKPPPGALLERAGLDAGALEKGPGLYGVPLPADSFSPSDARYASPMSPISP